MLLQILDIGLVLALTYIVLVLIGERRTLWMVRGFIVLMLVTAVSRRLGLALLSFFLSNLTIGAAVAMAVLLQSEFRRLLERLGRGEIGRLFAATPIAATQPDNTIDAIVEAVKELSQNRTGALIVLETSGPLDDRDFSVPGVKLNAVVSKELLQTIFQTSTLLHDGAVVIQGSQLSAAGTILPISEQQASRQLGTRHRAAMGITERVENCLCIVVSEETGSISVAERGQLNRPLTSSRLREILRAKFTPVGDRDAVTPGLLTLVRRINRHVRHRVMALMQCWPWRSTRNAPSAPLLPAESPFPPEVARRHDARSLARTATDGEPHGRDQGRSDRDRLGRASLVRDGHEGDRLIPPHDSPAAGLADLASQPMDQGARSPQVPPGNLPAQDSWRGDQPDGEPTAAPTAQPPDPPTKLEPDDPPDAVKATPATVMTTQIHDLNGEAVGRSLARAAGGDPPAAAPAPGRVDRDVGDGVEGERDHGELGGRVRGNPGVHPLADPRPNREMEGSGDPRDVLRGDGPGDNDPALDPARNPGQGEPRELVRQDSEPPPPELDAARTSGLGSGREDVDGGDLARTLTRPTPRSDLRAEILPEELAEELVEDDWLWDEEAGGDRPVNDATARPRASKLWDEEVGDR